RAYVPAPQPLGRGHQVAPPLEGAPREVVLPAEEGGQGRAPDGEEGRGARDLQLTVRTPWPRTPGEDWPRPKRGWWVMRWWSPASTRPDAVRSPDPWSPPRWCSIPR